MASVDLEQVGYNTNTALPTCEELRRQFSLLPGVETVGMIDEPPLSGRRGGVVTDRFDGYEGIEVKFGLINVGPECFHALGIPILEGREVAAGDFTAGRHVALVNESFARKFWPDQGVLGKEIEFRNDQHEVIGIVRDARLEDVMDPPKATAYLSLHPYFHALHPTFVVRTRPSSASGE
ncbi:MAG: hypothetical protein DME26_10020 [Verrucomicrobia bacterium]|nr:MAG: hypothetical protein DME26_10020 [Verrucomicrobiota bacterium]